MYQLVIHLTPEQEDLLADFLLENPDITEMETYLHTHSPFQHLGHYLWEELQEPNHSLLKEQIEFPSQTISNSTLFDWFEEEYEEYGLAPMVD